MTTAPPISASATLVNGITTVTFGSRPYRRVIILMDMVNSAFGPVTIYRGVPAGAFTRVVGCPQGSNQQYTQAINWPSGQGMFVQWDSMPNDLNDARATVTWME